MTSIHLENLGKTFGSFTALKNMNLEIADGEFVALLGPSGCGKSTTMNMISGMIEPSEGEIRFGDRDMRGVPMSRRGVGFVFQNYAIFTHMTVYENLAYGLRATGVAKAERERRVNDMAEFLQHLVILGFGRPFRAVGIAGATEIIIDPVQPFEGSVYEQAQKFMVAEDGNLCLLDWVSEGRTARGEDWDLRAWRGGMRCG